MHIDPAELPDDHLFIVLTGSDILEDFIVRQQFLVLVIIDGDTELVNILVGSKIMGMFLNGFHNVCSKALAVLLLVHEEGSTNQIGGVNNWSGIGRARGLPVRRDSRRIRAGRLLVVRRETRCRLTERMNELTKLILDVIIIEGIEAEVALIGI